MNQARLLALAAFVVLSTTLQAQQQGIGRPTAGIYGGYTHPTGTFKDEVGNGWHAGGLIKIRAYGALDLRLDGAYAKLGAKHIPLELQNGDTLSIHTDANIAYGTLAANLNLGSDSAAYPGDNTISPYLMGGVGIYHLDHKMTCTGTCTGVTLSEAGNHLGFNLGGGASVPVFGIRTFIEARYHRISRKPEDGDVAPFVTVSAGIKIR